MGVVRDTPDKHQTDESSLELLLTEITPSESSGANSHCDDDLSSVDSVSVRRERRRCRMSKRHNPPNCNGDSNITRKTAQGSKKYRRYENDLMLMSQADPADLEQVTIEDFIPTHVNPLGRIFLEKKCMMAWNRFMMAPENEQQLFLEKKRTTKQRTVDQKHTVIFKDSPKVSTGSSDDQESERLSAQPQDEIPRDASKAFKRISSRLRTLLKRKHTPLGAVSHMEKEVTEFFSQWPSSIFVYQLESSYLRLLLHGTCQYLGLDSHSYDQDGGRFSQVENPTEHFRPPTVTLAQLLESTRIK